MIHILGGGLFAHVRSHLAIAAPAFGGTARQLHAMLPGSTLHLTKMADSTSDIVTNDDVSVLVDRLIADPITRVIFFNMALCDYTGAIDDVPSGKYATRLKSREGEQTMRLTPADKLIGRIRKDRKDIFVIGFKTTADASPHDQYIAGLNLLKENSLNLVLANDIVTRNNMIVAPEETRYCETTDRQTVLEFLVKMVTARMTNTFARSTVQPGALYDFQSDLHIPNNLRTVVNHLVARGAYKVFRNSTVGHFAARLDTAACLTSRRKTNYNEPGGLDLVEVEYDGTDKVIAYGAKPSVGGQSQRIIFDHHEDVDCIVHAHVPLREDAPDDIPIAEQWENECGSISCGTNSSNNLRRFDHGIYAVMLRGHGPNICYSQDVPADKVIDFIERNFDLGAKTGGSVELAIEEMA